MPQKNDSSDGRPLRGVAAIPKSLLSWLNDCVGAHSSGCALTSRLQHKPLCADFLLGDYRMVALCVKMGSLFWDCSSLMIALMITCVTPTNTNAPFSI